MSRHQELCRQIHAFIKSETNYDDAIAWDQPLFDSGILDSLKVFELATYLQQELNVILEDEDLDIENFATITAIAALADRRIA